MRAALGIIAVALAFASGCVKQQDWIDRTLVTTDVSGVWTGSMATLDGQPMISIDVRLDLRQKAAKVTGSFEAVGGLTLGSRKGSSSPIEGSVASDVFTFQVGRQVTGEVTVAGDEMEGHGVLGQGRRIAITLRRADTPSPAASPPR